VDGNVQRALIHSFPKLCIGIINRRTVGRINSIEPSFEHRWLVRNAREFGRCYDRNLGGTSYVSDIAF